ncbi:hypothetical protein [Abyssisolibacter fermentans]|uniref:hypothetical protein n=1 Tax=Abyssisolibacter fermentans TaxID=1766203 RepID=UPI0008330BF7|nr:hypothetical protein [Abyssisolibacter fermentans]
MGLFEILFEKFNPGGIGKIEKFSNKPKETNIIILLLKLIISILIIWFLFHITIRYKTNAENIIKFIIILFIYCLISYMIVPKPDYSNIGWFGGLINNPFRFSDNLNRMLIFLMFLLYPGRFIAITFVQTFHLFKH